MIGDPVKREAKHQFARARRPAERGLGLAHSLPGADDPPHDVRQPWTGPVDRRAPVNPGTGPGWQGVVCKKSTN